MKPYYYVHIYQNKATEPRHSTLSDAQAEAERLATVHKGKFFEIRKCVGISVASVRPSTFFLDGEGHEFEELREKLSSALRS